MGPALRLRRRHRRAGRRRRSCSRRRGRARATTAGGRPAEAARALGYQVAAHTLGRGRRIRPQPGRARRPGGPGRCGRDAQQGALHGRRAPAARHVCGRWPRWQEAEPGTLGIAVLVRPDLPMEATRLVHMSVLRADRVLRAALVVDLTVDGRPISVAGTHMSHLPFGSHRNWAELRRQLQTEARPDAVLAGDMNTWGPLVRLFMPGWRRAVDRRRPGRPGARTARSTTSSCAARVRPVVGRGAPARRLGPPARAGRARGRRPAPEPAPAGPRFSSLRPAAMARRPARVTASSTVGKKWSSPMRAARPLRRRLSRRCTPARATPKAIALALAERRATWLRARVPVKSMSDMPTVSRTSTRTGPARAEQRARTSSRKRMALAYQIGVAKSSDQRRRAPAPRSGSSVSGAASWWCRGCARARAAAGGR